MKTWEILAKAKERISNPDNWVRGKMYAPHTKTYIPNLPLEQAECFCSVGAVAAAIGVPNSRYIDASALWNGGDNDSIVELFGKDFARAVKYLHAASMQMDAVGGRYFSAIGFNDDVTNSHADIMRLFDVAIKNAKRRHANGKRYKNAAA